MSGYALVVWPAAATDTLADVVRCGIVGANRTVPYRACMSLEVDTAG